MSPKSKTATRAISVEDPYLAALVACHLATMPGRDFCRLYPGKCPTDPKRAEIIALELEGCEKEQLLELYNRAVALHHKQVCPRCYKIIGSKVKACRKCGTPTHLPNHFLGVES